MLSPVGFAQLRAVSSGNDPLSVSPGTSFHHQSAARAGFFDAVYLRDIRMIRRPQDLRFALKASQSLGILYERRGKNFDRYFPIQLGVLGAINLTHPAFTDRRKDFVRAEFIAWLKRHRCVRAKFSRSERG
jgi:hypothetical protein